MHLQSDDQPTAPPPDDVVIDLTVRLDDAIQRFDARAPFLALISELATDARARALPPETLLVLIKTHLWQRTTGLDMVARRELVDSSVRLAIEAYYRAG